ncbi:hypothetical protein Y032_0498g2530 [Ancylostoma ceylanicum]|uniref:Uncharacterized protein n=1 Tax=Ancylostoma ceylanicum TaxID=53326 RepID=A0A016WUC8_9BILA|nr:hypothetical protein Y032_0498g2530 [Ancylostoma ceylanicum]
MCGMRSRADAARKGKPVLLRPSGSPTHCYNNCYSRCRNIHVARARQHPTSTALASTTWMLRSREWQS